MRRPGDIPLTVLHPVPMRLLGARGGRERVAYASARTPAVLRGVAPATLRPAFPGTPGLSRVRLHGGRLWEAVEAMVGHDGEEWLETLDLATAVGLLEGTAPHAAANAWILCGPVGTAYPSRVAPEWVPDAPEPAKARERLVEDIEPLAREAVRSFLADALIHDGRRLYQALPAPKLRAPPTGTGRRPELHVPGLQRSHLTYAASPSQSGPFGLFLSAVSGLGHYALPAGHVPGRAVDPARAARLGLAEDDAHVGEFVHMAPPRLMQVLASLDRISLSPEAGDLTAEARVHERRLGPWFARGLVRATPRGEWAAAIDEIVRAAGFLARLRGDPHSREELDAMAAFGRLVAAPSYPPAEPPSEDVDAMGSLSP